MATTTRPAASRPAARLRVGALVLGLSLGAVVVGCGAQEKPESSGSDSSTANSSPLPSADRSQGSDGPAPSTAGDAGSGAAADGTSGLDLSTVSGDRGLFAVVAGSPSTGAQSLRGKLIVAERGCLHLSRRSAPPTLLVFPPDTELDTSRSRRPAVVVDGSRHRVGTPLSLRGEGVQLGPDQAARAKPCVARGAVFAVSDIS